MPHLRIIHGAIHQGEADISWQELMRRLRARDAVECDVPAYDTAKARAVIDRYRASPWMQRLKRERRARRRDAALGTAVMLAIVWTWWAVAVWW